MKEGKERERRREKRIGRGKERGGWMEKERNKVRSQFDFLGRPLYK